MRRSSLSAALLGLLACASVSFAEEPAQPGCVWKGMRQRPAGLIAPCTSILANKDIADAARADALYTRGRAYHNMLQLDAALRDYNAALELTQDNVDILVSRANVYRRQGWGNLALNDLAKAAVINPNHVELLISFGNIHWMSGNPNKAIEFLSRAIELDPKATFAYIKRKDAFEEINKLDEALADADAAVRVSQEPDQPNYFERGFIVRDIRIAALLRRAQLLEKMGQTERSAQDFDAAVAKDPSAFALIDRVQHMKRPASVDIADLQEAIRREPRNTGGLYTLGLRLMGEQQFDAALTAFDQAIDIDPYHAYSLRMRARIHREAGRTEEAMQDFVRAIYADRRILAETIPSLRMAGYWHSTQVPERMTPALADALQACMLDTKCN